jgi:hypothetical protein
MASTEEVTRLLKGLNERIGQVESRLIQLESSKVILEEKKVIAKEKELEGKTYITTGDGGILKEIRVGVCDSCGRNSERFNACPSCGDKLCEECSILFHGRIYCANCLNEEIPLTKQEYKILTVKVDADGMGLNEIADLTKMKKDDTREYAKSLIDKGMMEKKEFLFFSDTKVLDKGLEVLAAYRQVYGKEEDVIALETELGRLLGEKS